VKPIPLVVKKVISHLPLMFTLNLIYSKVWEPVLESISEAKYFVIFIENRTPMTDIHYEK